MGVSTSVIKKFESMMKKFAFNLNFFLTEFMPSALLLHFIADRFSLTQKGIKKNSSAYFLTCSLVIER